MKKFSNEIRFFQWWKSLVTLLVLLSTGSSAFAQQTAPAHTKPGATPSLQTVAALSKLYELRFWTGKSYSLKDDANKQAIVAFQKLAGLPRTGKLNDVTIARIQEAKAPVAHILLPERHLEVDLNHQVLFVVDSNDNVEHILPVSTGNGKQFDFPGKGPEYARTPRGKFKVFYKISGWRKSPLGMMFNPMYFQGGFAMHGASNVPPTPASHGCIRIPMFAMEDMFQSTPVGTPVIVFGENPSQ